MVHWNASQFIPKIIHQTWKNEVDYMEYSQTWKEKHPDWVYMFWDDNDCGEFVSREYPKYRGVYLGLNAVQKADLFRYLVLHKYGGIYADIDTKCVQNLDHIVRIPKMVVGVEYNSMGGKRQILQWFICSCPQNPILLEVANTIKFRSYIPKAMAFGGNRYTYWLTGPEVFSQVINKYTDMVKIYPKCVFGSFDRSQRCVDKMLVKHGFHGTWKQGWNGGVDL